MRRSTSKIPAEVIPIAKIRIEPDKVKLAKAEIDALATEIKNDEGLLYPIIVRLNAEDVEKPYFTIKSGWGRKRLEAAKSLGWKEIKAIIVPSFAGKSNADKIVERFVSIIQSCQDTKFTDYDIGKAACELEDRYLIKGSTYARVLGISQGYTYNLMRWYRNIPDIVRDAWREKDPFINHTELEHMSQLNRADASSYWKKRHEMGTIQEPFSPLKNGKPGLRALRKAKRATNDKMIKLVDAIGQSNLRDPIKRLAMDIAKFSMGTVRDVNGITNYNKLDPSMIVSKDSKKNPQHPTPIGGVKASAA